MIKYADGRGAKAMGHLGARLIVCPSCETNFNVDRLPRYWICVLVDGELSDAGDVSELCCSRECADEYVEGLRQADPPENMGFYIHVVTDADTMEV